MSEKKSDKPIYVTRSSLPALEEYVPHLEKLWESRYLTNSGEFHQQLEKGLEDYLGVSHLSLFSSGTAALLAAFKVSELPEGGEVITTPFTFIVTAHALMWCGLKPVFVDVDPVSANIDPAKIEEAVTPRTCAILGVHCYGQVCDTKAIAAIAEKHGLKFFYDAAHAFAVEDEQGSILRCGDFAALSFHATKVFNTAEGGALVCRDAEMKERVDSFKNFGFNGEITAEDIGFNGKMSELSAALGVAQLTHVDEYIAARQKIDTAYRKALEKIDGIEPLDFGNLKRANYSYFPVRITERYPLSRDELFEKYKEHNIFTRRYFYPLVTDFGPYQGMKADIPVAQKLVKEILCLPIYEGMSDAEFGRILGALKL